jgi:hypothetical protein
MLNINPEKIAASFNQLTKNFDGYDWEAYEKDAPGTAQSFYERGVRDALANANQFLDPPLEGRHTTPLEPNENG